MSAPHAAPHAHDAENHAGSHDAHGHGPANDPRVVAVIVLLVALGATVSLGLVAPQSRRVAGQRGAAPAAPQGESPLGIVVTTDGQVAVGVVSEEKALVRVRTAEGERIFPRSKVRHVDARSSELGEDYYRKHGDAPIADEKYARASDGGIVILKSGQVLVGRLAISDRAITVRWPYKEQLYGGELTVPRDAVRWFKTGSDAPTQEYWQEFGDAPIHLPRPGTGAAPDRRGSQAPQDPDRAEAEVAMSQGRWQEAARRWSHIARRTNLAADLENLRRCCERVLKESRSADALATAQLIDDTLASVPATPGGEGLRVHACELAITYSITNRQLEEGERWAHRLADIGPSWIEKSNQVLAGIKAIREKDAEEAAEGHEDEHGEGDGHKH